MVFGASEPGDREEEGDAVYGGVGARGIEEKKEKRSSGASEPGDRGEEGEAVFGGVEPGDQGEDRDATRRGLKCTSQVAQRLDLVQIQAE